MRSYVSIALILVSVFTEGTALPDEECKDRYVNPQVCKGYAERGWCTSDDPGRHGLAKANCAKTCNLCSSTQEPAPSEGAGESGEECKDRYVNPQVCKGYAERGWCTSDDPGRHGLAKANCAKTCNLCSSTQEPAPSQGAGESGEECKDRYVNPQVCKGYAERGWCTSDDPGRHGLAKANCAKTCNLCSSAQEPAPSQGAGESGEECKDRYVNPQVCKGYAERGWCTSDDPGRHGLAKANCAKTCNLCSSAQEPAPTQGAGDSGESEPIRSAGESGEECKDRYVNPQVCKGYAERGWCTSDDPGRHGLAKANCAKTCSLCSSTQEPAPSQGAGESGEECKDRYVNPQVCKGYAERGWCTSDDPGRQGLAKANCAKTCNLCGSAQEPAPSQGVGASEESAPIQSAGESGEECKDRYVNPQVCKGYAERGWCTSDDPGRHGLAKANCAKTCNLCSSTKERASIHGSGESGEECKDRYVNPQICKGYAERGWCTSNDPGRHGLAEANCAKTCNLCHQ